MKALRFTLMLVLTGFGTSVVAQNAATPTKSYTDKLMPEIEVGTLMCKDYYGKLVKCTGDEFDKIAGFATSSPYITVNKKDTKDAEAGFVALTEGSLSVGDYVSAAPEGKIAKCDMENAYAKVISVSGKTVRVRILTK